MAFFVFSEKIVAVAHKPSYPKKAAGRICAKLKNYARRTSGGGK